MSLTLVLTLPDIAGKIEDPPRLEKGMLDWFDKHALDKI
jgi:hypothetical protein